MHRPPAWRDIFGRTPDYMERVFSSNLLTKLVDEVKEKYPYWDTFRHYPLPDGIAAEEAWSFLKFSRLSSQEQTPIKSKGGSAFWFTLTKTLYRRLSIIDTHAAGLIQTLTDAPNAPHKEQLVISGLTEEAIASSQIEGASTSRKVAKEMLLSGRSPRTKDEQMIINNYQAMQKLEDLKEVELSETMLLDLQSTITRDTLEDAGQSGRFRRDDDKIVVYDRLTGEIVFIPPTEKAMRSELKRLIAYANAPDKDADFVHPVIKATILHFWVAYLHPFADGNGRTARAVFHWYLAKRGYWLFKYLSVSRVIKTSRKSYDEAFLHSEMDEEDLTYFILYITKSVCRAIDDLLVYYKKKAREIEEFQKIASRYAGLNERQVALLSFFQRHPELVTDIKTHQSKHGVVYQTARKDLLDLAEKDFIVEMRRGKKKLFLPNTARIRKVFA